jgi:hypothetical protein
MTQYSPPPGTPVGPTYIPTQTPQSNPLAIVSLVCGIIGCCGVTALVSIVTGIIGLSNAKKTGTGRGMSIAGILLSLLWIVGGIGGGVFFYRTVSTAVSEVARPTIESFVNHLADGNIDAAAEETNISRDDLTRLSAEIQQMGHVSNLQFGFPSYNNTNGAVTINVEGNGTFDKVGQKNVSATLIGTNDALKINQIEIK